MFDNSGTELGMFAEYKQIAGKGSWKFSEPMEAMKPMTSIVPFWFASHYVIPNNIKVQGLNAPDYNPADFLKLANEAAQKKFGGS